MNFWEFLTIFFLVDSFIYLQGYDTFFWTHKTDAEKEIQRKKLGVKNGRE